MPAFDCVLGYVLNCASGNLLDCVSGHVSDCVPGPAQCLTMCQSLRMTVFDCVPGQLRAWAYAMPGCWTS